MDAPPLTTADHQFAKRRRLSLAIVAGEASGDLLAGAVLRGLSDSLGDIDSIGVGGPALRAAGMNTWTDISALSVRGYAEVVAALPRLLWLRSSLRRRFQRLRPDLFLGVDAPDFNLALERDLKAAGIRTVHFISPSIWAWRPERIDSIRVAVDHMLLVFPFEQDIFDRAGIAATYVGHPLADMLEPISDSSRPRRELGLHFARPVVALLPGSRPDEIRYMAKTFLAAAAWLHARIPEVQFVLPAASEPLHAELARLVHAEGLHGKLDLHLILGQSHRAMAAADTVLVASGTATLEAALLAKPMTISYQMSPISYRIMRRKGIVPWIGLPNILCKESLVPEFIQGAASAHNLGASLLAQLSDEALRTRLRQRFSDLHGTLKRNCAARSAEVIATLVGERRGHPL